MEETSLKEVLVYLLKKIYVAIIIMAVVVGGREIYARTKAEVITYTSTAKVLVMENEKLELTDNLIGSYAEIVKSRESLEMVKKNLGLDLGVDVLMGEVTASGITGTNVLGITVTDTDGDRAAQIVTESINVLKNRVTGIYGVDNIRTVDGASNAAASQNASMRSRLKKSAELGIALGVVTELAMYYVSKQKKTA